MFATSESHWIITELSCLYAFLTMTSLLSSTLGFCCGKLMMRGGRCCGACRHVGAAGRTEGTRLGRAVLVLEACVLAAFVILSIVLLTMLLIVDGDDDVLVEVVDARDVLVGAGFAAVVVTIDVVVGAVFVVLVVIVVRLFQSFPATRVVTGLSEVVVLSYSQTSSLGSKL